MHRQSPKLRTVDKENIQQQALNYILIYFMLTVRLIQNIYKAQYRTI